MQLMQRGSRRSLVEEHLRRIGQLGSVAFTVSTAEINHLPGHEIAAR